MQYLTEAGAINEAIAFYAQAKTLWLDTEVADYNTSQPRLSLVQILHDSTDLQGDRVTIFEVLDQPQLVEPLIQTVMLNPKIEKVFHNASYDLQFLGGRRKVPNVTCTLEMVKKIPYYLVPLPNHQLKTLARQLCHFSHVDSSEQGGDWGRRPLSEQQLHYAKMDPVYLAQVHHRLLQLSQLIEPDPETEDIDALTARYRQIEEPWKLLNTEVEHLKKRLKGAMESQAVSEIDGFKLSGSKRTKKKISFVNLVKAIEAAEVEVDFSIDLTRNLQKKLDPVIDYLAVKEETTSYSRLNIRDMSNLDDEDLPF